jgi:hypothetical protein
MKTWILAALILCPLTFAACQKPKGEIPVEDAGKGEKKQTKPDPGLGYEPNEGNGRADERTFSLPIRRNNKEPVSLRLVFSSKRYEKFEIQRIRYQFQCDNGFQPIVLSLTKANGPSNGIEKGRVYEMDQDSRYTLSISSDTSDCERANVGITARLFN